MVFVELPEVGKKVEKGKEAAVVESVKAASEVYAPVAGEVVEVNERAGRRTRARSTRTRRARAGSPSCKLADKGELDALMDEAAYKEYCRGPALMRYLPLTDADRRAMLATIGAPLGRLALFATCRRRPG